jgi:hypothetical protein
LIDSHSPPLVAFGGPSIYPTKYTSIYMTVYYT